MGDVWCMDYDIVEMAFLLKSIGFQLKSFEFAKPHGDEHKDIEIDLSCQSSGFKARFILPASKCRCPPKPSENNNSFWEIQGKSPATPTKKLVMESACTILPELNKKTLSLARSTLIMLLQHFRNDLVAEQKLNGIKDTSKSPEVLAMTANASPSGLEFNRQTDSNASYASTPLNANVASSQQALTDQIRANIPKIKLEADPESIVQNTQTNVEMYTSPKNTQGMSSVVFPSPQLSKVETDREVLVIEAISKARKELDAALIHLKCNITRDLSDNSILTKTPTSNKVLSTSTQNAIANSRRRASLGSSDAFRTSMKEHDQFHFSRPPSKLTNGTSGKFKPNNLVKTKPATQPDTPRPQVDLKQTVEKGIAKSKLLRSVSSTALKGPTAIKSAPLGRQKSALPIKKT